MKGVEGSQQDYGMRIYDPRVGRFLSVDPMASSYPWNSSYAYAENEPISNIDLDGLEKVKSNNSFSAIGKGIKQGWNETKASWNSLFSRQTLTDMKSTAKDVYGTYVKADPNAIRSFNKRVLNFSMGVNNTIQNYTTQPVLWTMGIPGRSREENLKGLGYGIWKGLELYTLAKAPEILGPSEADAIFSKLSRQAMPAYEGNMIIGNALKGGAKIVVVGGEEAALMKVMGKQAGIRWMGNGVADIQITADASRAAIMEEAIHYEQYLKYGEDFMYDKANYLQLELEAQDRLLQIGAKERWSEAEINQIKGAKATYEKELQKESKKRR